MAYRPDSSEGVASGEFALHCRGEVRLFCGGAECTPRSKKGRALLAVLAAEQRPLGRTRIVDLLWSDRQEEQARASLRTLLADMRSQFDGRIDDLLTVERERIALAPGVRTDLADPALARPAGELFEGLDHIDPELDDWLRVEREKWGRSAPAPPRGTAAEPRRIAASMPWWALAALLAAIAAAALLVWRSRVPPQPPVVAVLQFTDLTGRHRLLADGLAEEVRLGLAQNPRIEVIGRASSEDPSLQALTAGQRLNATHVIEGSLRALGAELQLNVRLTDAGSGRALWSGSARAGGAAVAIGTTAVATEIAELLTDALSLRLPPHTLRADHRAYETVFAARAAMAAGPSHAAAQQRSALEAIVAANPDFVPGLVTLSRATMSASDHPFTRGPIPLARARREAAEYARRAIRLAPSYAPAYEALASAYRDMDEALPLLRKAASLSPGVPIVHRRLAWELEQNGAFNGSLEHWRTAARLDPLNLTSHVQLMRALDFSGDGRELRRVGAEFAGRLSDPKTRWTFDAIRAAYRGDWSRFAMSAIRAERLDPEDPYTQRLLMNVLELLFGKAAARPYAGADASFTALVMDRDGARIIRKMNEAPAEFFRLNFETGEVAEYLASAGRLDALIAAYDRARASIHPPTGSELSLVGDLLVVGLREQGRTAEADKLLAFLEVETRRARGLRPEYVDASTAFWDMLGGRTDRAAARLDRAYRDEWALGLIHDGTPTWSRHVFRPIQGNPRIAKIRQRYQREMAREADEAVREMLAANIRPLRCKAIPRVCPGQVASNASPAARPS